MRKLILTYLFLILPLTANSAEINKPIDISADELHKMLDDEADLILIDARNEKKFKESHIKGAINIPADKINSETLAKASESMTEKLVFYCQDINCTASRIGAAKAIGAGYKYVYEYLGGIDEWKQKGYSVE